MPGCGPGTSCLFPWVPRCGAGRGLWPHGASVQRQPGPHGDYTAFVGPPLGAPGGGSCQGHTAGGRAGLSPGISTDPSAGWGGGRGGRVLHALTGKEHLGSRARREELSPGRCDPGSRTALAPRWTGRAWLYQGKCGRRDQRGPCWRSDWARPSGPACAISGLDIAALCEGAPAVGAGVRGLGWFGEGLKGVAVVWGCLARTLLGKGEGPGLPSKAPGTQKGEGTAASPGAGRPPLPRPARPPTGGVLWNMTRSSPGSGRSTSILSTSSSGPGSMNRGLARRPCRSLLKVGAGGCCAGGLTPSHRPPLYRVPPVDTRGPPSSLQHNPLSTCCIPWGMNTPQGRDVCLSCHCCVPGPSAQHVLTWRTLGA